MARWVSLYAINTASLSFLLTLEACLSHIGKKDRLLQLLVWSPNLFDFIHLRSGSVLFVCPLLIKTSIYQRIAGKKKGPLSVWAFEMGHELAKMAGAQGCCLWGSSRHSSSSQAYSNPSSNSCLGFGFPPVQKKHWRWHRTDTCQLVSCPMLLCTRRKPHPMFRLSSAQLELEFCLQAWLKLELMVWCLTVKAD